MQRSDSFEKTLMVGMIKDWRRRGQQRMRWHPLDGILWMAIPTQWTWVWVDSMSWWCTGRPGMLQSMESQRVGHDWMTEANWFLHTKLLWDIMTYKNNKLFFINLKSGQSSLGPFVFAPYGANYGVFTRAELSWVEHLLPRWLIHIAGKFILAIGTSLCWTLSCSGLDFLTMWGLGYKRDHLKGQEVDTDSFLRLGLIN